MMLQNELKLLEKMDAERVVCDYIAGMSDSYAVQKFSDLFLPRPWMIK
jgi:dGTPase